MHRKEYNMEENINYENKNEKKCEHNCVKKCIAMLLAAFLGGFLASYFVLDQMAERKLNHHPFHHKKFEKRMMKDFEKLHKKQMHEFDEINKELNKFVNPKFNDDSFEMPLFMDNSVSVKTDYDNDKFNIIIGLKPFQNDENKIKYDVNGRKLTVFGNSQVKDNNLEEDIAFSQDFILPQDADTKKITKSKVGKNLVISVPVKE